MKIKKIVLVMLVVSAVALAASAQLQERFDSYPVTSRTTAAVNYKHRGGATKLDFKGTELLPNASGEAKVESKKGYIEIEVEFDELQKATKFGNEYLTYVLWAITPEGRPANLGEVLLDGNRSKLNVTTQLQSFALIVTAEPYFAARRPSDVVVLENVVRPDTRGTTDIVDAKYELIARGGYIPTGFTFDPVVLKADLPLQFYQARNAMRIAESAGAEQHAAASYQNAARLMQQADAHASKKNVQKKVLVSISREVVQTAEDAREIAVRHLETARIAADARSSADREADARDRANDEAQRRRNAEADTADAQRRQDEAERNNREAQAAAQLAARNQEEAERARAAAQLQQQTAEAESARNRAAIDAAEQQRLLAVQEQEALRARLLEQFNAVFETRDTARGLIVNMSDVLFDTAQHTLRPLAREKLARISGIMAAHPGLRLEIEGNTDSVGTDHYNQGLSERRAESVRSYLAQHGVPASAMTAVGLGEGRPVSSNDTAQGRQENRRVELVVSGEVIGTKISRSQPGDAPNPRRLSNTRREPAAFAPALFVPSGEYAQLTAIVLRRDSCGRTATHAGVQKRTDTRPCRC